MVNTVVGYTGGSTKNPTYQTVCAGDGHTEAMEIQFDPDRISYDQLLEQYFDMAGLSPLDGPDVLGTSMPRFLRSAQYKNAIWTHSAEQKQKAQSAAASRMVAAKLDIDGKQPFHKAEEYHQKYYDKKRPRPGR